MVAERTSGRRLWLFNGGTFKVPAALMDRDAGPGTIEIPTVWAAVEHAGGVLLVDTGPAPPERSGSLAQPYGVASGLARIGASADDVTHVVLTHLHVDHVGGNTATPDARFLVQAGELAYAAAPSDACMQAEYDSDLVAAGELDYAPLDGATDVLGDGTVCTVLTPGHSPGHQSVLVRLPGHPPSLLAGDAIWTAACRDERVHPGLAWREAAYEESRRRLLRLAAMPGCRWVHSHEPTTFDAPGWALAAPA